MDIAQKSNQSAHDEWREISRLLQKMYKGHNHLKEKDLLEFLSQIVVSMRSNIRREKEMKTSNTVKSWSWRISLTVQLNLCS